MGFCGPHPVTKRKKTTDTPCWRRKGLKSAGRASLLFDSPIGHPFLPPFLSSTTRPQWRPCLFLILACPPTIADNLQPPIDIIHPRSMDSVTRSLDSQVDFLRTDSLRNHDPQSASQWNITDRPWNVMKWT